jgi:hypothetical protein
MALDWKREVKNTALWETVCVAHGNATSQRIIFAVPTEILRDTFHRLVLAGVVPTF